MLAESTDGEPVLTKFANGKGTVMVCNSPIDRESVARTDVFAGESVMPYYLVLAEAKKVAGVRRLVEKADCPQVVLTEHPAADGRTLVVAVNCDTSGRTCPVSCRGRVGRVWRGDVTASRIRLAANEAAVFEVLEESP